MEKQVEIYQNEKKIGDQIIRKHENAEKVCIVLKC